MQVTLKINGQPIVVETETMHESWINKCLAYGIRRYPNDTHSGLTGQKKFEAVAELCKDMQSGEAAPERVSRVAVSRDPVNDLALKSAKTDLNAMFRAVTKKSKAIDMAAHEKVRVFFTVKDGSARWNDDIVMVWIASQESKGKRDYVGEAQETLAANSDESESDLDF